MTEKDNTAVSLSVVCSHSEEAQELWAWAVD